MLITGGVLFLMLIRGGVLFLMLIRGGVLFFACTVFFDVLSSFTLRGRITYTEIKAGSPADVAQPSVQKISEM